MRPCPWGKVNNGPVLTIGQLAKYVGVSTKTIRVYHAKGLLPEPERDSSGYRRYGAEAVVDLIRIRTLAEAGVPLARIRNLGAGQELAAALQQIDDDLTHRIRGLEATQARLRELASGDVQLLPAEVDVHLRGLAELGFSDQWVAMERDLWIIVFATYPETGDELFRDQAGALAEPALRELYLDYDRARDLRPDDPTLVELADRIIAASIERYGTDLPGQAIDPNLPQLLQNTVNASSPAWRRLDQLIRRRLG